MDFETILKFIRRGKIKRAHTLTHTHTQLPRRRRPGPSSSPQPTLSSPKLGLAYSPLALPNLPLPCRRRARILLFPNSISPVRLGSTGARGRRVPVEDSPAREHQSSPHFPRRGRSPEAATSSPMAPPSGNGDLEPAMATRSCSGQTPTEKT